MSQIIVILALLFSLIIALLSIANNQPVVINYLLGRAEVSTVLVILGSAILGALAIFLLSLFRHIKVSIQFRSMRSEIKSLQEKIAALEGERDALLAEIGQLAGDELSQEEEVSDTTKQAIEETVKREEEGY